MYAVPIALPVTTPAISTDAIEALLVDHPPPDVRDDKLVVEPRHTDAVPVIADGNAFTVTLANE
jgi:hypothetical protein